MELARTTKWKLKVSSSLILPKCKRSTKHFSLSMKPSSLKTLKSPSTKDLTHTICSKILTQKVLYEKHWKSEQTTFRQLLTNACNSSFKHYSIFPPLSPLPLANIQSVTITPHGCFDPGKTTWNWEVLQFFILTDCTLPLLSIHLIKCALYTLLDHESAKFPSIGI